MISVYARETLIADSDQTIIVEGNHYFPPDSLINKGQVFSNSGTSSLCPWKGVASYYNATIDGFNIPDIAWFYPEALPAAANIRNYVAFYKNKTTITE